MVIIFLYNNLCKYLPNKILRTEVVIIFDCYLLMANRNAKKYYIMVFNNICQNTLFLY